MGALHRRRRPAIASVAMTAAALAMLSAPASAEEVECLAASGVPKTCDAQSPTASFEFSPEEPKRRELVTFTGTAAAASGRTVHSVRWDLYNDGLFEDGDTETAERAFGKPGAHRVALRVEDDRGEVAIVRETVQVTDPDVAVPALGEAVAVRQNPFHDGFLDASEPAPPLGLEWERTLEGESAYALVAAGKIFVTVRVPATDARDLARVSRVYAFDAATGAIVWSRLLGDRYGRSRAAYEDGRLFVVNSDGLILALDAADGRTLWAENVHMDSVSQPPVAYDGHVYLVGGGVGGVLYALDAVTGETVWSNGVFNGHPPSPTIGPNDVLLSAPCPGTLALDRFWGYAQWWNQTGCSGSGGLWPSPYRNGLIHAAEGGEPGKVYRLDGSFVRDFTADYAPAVSDDLALYVQDGEMRAERPESGAPLWSFAGDGRLAGAPLIVGDTAYVGSQSGRLYGVDTSSGLETWHSDLAGTARGELAAGGGRLVLMSGERLRVFGDAPAAPPPGEQLPGAHDLVGDLPPIEAVPAEAVTFQLDAGHTGFLNAAEPAPPLRERWTRDYLYLGENPLTYPLIADGRVFVVERNQTGWSGPAATVHALDAVSGESLWDVELAGGLGERWVSAAYGNGRVYVLAHDGTLRALDAATGAERWSMPLDGSTSGAPPVAVDGEVYVAAGTRVIALSAADGHVLWDRPVHSGFGSGPAVAGDVVYGSWSCRSTWALSRASGEVLWRNFGSCSGGGGLTPVAAGGRLYMREKDVGRTSASETGRFVDGFAGDGPPALAGDVMVVVANGELFAQQASTGRLLWRFQGDGWLTSAPLVVGRHVYVGSGRAHNDSRLFVVDLADGSLVWDSALPGKVDRPDDDGNLPITGLAAGGGIVVVPAGGRLLAFESAGAPPAAPETHLGAHPGEVSAADGVRFEFSSPAVDARFQCRLDGAPWTACRSPLVLSGLAEGARRLEVRAVSRGGMPDASPAAHAWRVEHAAGPGGPADKDPQGESPGAGAGTSGGGGSSAGPGASAGAGGSAGAGSPPATAGPDGAAPPPGGLALRLARLLRATGSTGLLRHGRVRLSVEGPDTGRLSALVLTAKRGGGRGPALARGAAELHNGRGVLELRVTRQGRRILRRSGRHILQIRLTLSTGGSVGGAGRRVRLAGAGPARPG